MHRRHAISPGLAGHYQDIGILSFNIHDSACNLTLSVGMRSTGAGSAGPGPEVRRGGARERAHGRAVLAACAQHAGLRINRGAYIHARTVFLNTFQPAEILALAGGMAPPSSTRISTRLKRVQEHVSPLGKHARTSVAWAETPVRSERAS